MIKAKIVLFTSKTLKDETHPVLLRITQGEKLAYLSMGVSCRLDQWDDGDWLKKNFPNAVRWNNRIRAKLAEAEKYILKQEEEDKPCTPKDVILTLRGETNIVSFFTFTEKEISKMKQAKQLGNADCYETAMNQVKEFMKEKDLLLTEINYKFLTELEAYFRSRGNKPNTISNYMRTIRAIYNRAIKEGLIPESPYPFDQYKIKYQDPMKRAITREDMRKVRDLDLEVDSPLWIARSMFMFSFYAMGMNIIDMALLKSKDIKDGYMHYQRMKTGHEYKIKISTEMQAILDHFCKDKKKGDYVFPIVEHKELDQIRRDIKLKTHLFNDYLKAIAKEVGIQTNLSTYVARHTWATLANRSNVNIGIIAEGLGHRDIKTTQTYLAKFGSEELDKANELITDI
ncbi:MAG TPA: site-specific integrase [Bacteroidales bacterium]|nr:site-specific integrase [Bacteroidales bacterium]